MTETQRKFAYPMWMAGLMTLAAVIAYFWLMKEIPEGFEFRATSAYFIVWAVVIACFQSYISSDREEERIRQYEKVRTERENRIYEHAGEAAVAFLGNAFKRLYENGIPVPVPQVSEFAPLALHTLGWKLVGKTVRRELSSEDANEFAFILRQLHLLAKDEPSLRWVLKVQTISEASEVQYKIG
jgi:hypothetical protein